jgi:hypothetical protein
MDKEITCRSLTPAVEPLAGAVQREFTCSAVTWACKF